MEGLAVLGMLAVFAIAVLWWQHRRECLWLAEALYTMGMHSRAGTSPYGWVEFELLLRVRLEYRAPLHSRLYSLKRRGLVEVRNFGALEESWRLSPPGLEWVRRFV